MFGLSKTITESDLVDLHGKVAIVTGGNTGIGWATIQFLARKGAKVYMGARDEGRARAAIKELEAENLNDGSVHFLKLDLSDPRNARATAREFLDKEDRLDILVNNGASGSLGPRVLTEDGILDIMVTNHFSHFVLTDALLPLLKQTSKKSTSSDVRIVNVSSVMHSDAKLKPETFATKEAFNKTYGEAPTELLTTYANTKLANILHAKALQRRLSAESIPITVISLHPGAIKTSGLNTYFSSIPYYGWLLTGLVAPLFFGTRREGAMTSAFAAAGKEVAREREKYKGAYLVRTAAIAVPSSFARDERLQEELYETSQRLMMELDW
ncbi:NAD(P)-binding protein [Mycena galopus ATCC 62051]|nr:NAD(P)-binding protein [Mycena galopus ATCC 62051]